MTLPGWDTHNNTPGRIKTLSEQLDQPMATLIGDLKERGLLDNTLVIWMGEFGRSPRITSGQGSPGRNHYPKAWTSVLFGGGIKGGQVIGKTDAEGAEVIERPISGLDFLATICKVLGMDPLKQNMSNVGRPIRLADPAARPINELLG